MKKTISSIIVVIFGLLQLVLPLTDTDITLWVRIIIILVFTAVWAFFTARADEISEFICRNILGRDLNAIDRFTIAKEFRCDILPKAIEIEQFLEQSTLLPENIVGEALYDNWCFVINYIKTYCLTRSGEINNKVVCTTADTYIPNYRLTKVNPDYVFKVIKVLISFRETQLTIISKQNDFAKFNKKLSSIENAFSNIYSA